MKALHFCPKETETGTGMSGQYIKDRDKVCSSSDQTSYICMWVEKV